MKIKYKIEEELILGDEGLRHKASIDLMCPEAKLIRSEDKKHNFVIYMKSEKSIETLATVEPLKEQIKTKKNGKKI